MSNKVETELSKQMKQKMSSADSLSHLKSLYTGLCQEQNLLMFSGQ